MVKQGVGIDFEHRERIAKLLRYESTSGDGLVSLAEYVGRMKEGQPAVYYAIGESRRALEGAPHLEGLRKRGFEVLLMTDPIDEWAIDSLRTFEGKPLVSAMRADLKIEAKEEDKQARAAEAETLRPLLDRIRAVLGTRVSEVRTTDRLTDSPCCLVLAGAGPHGYVERLLREAGRDVPASKRILEVNPGHAVVQNLSAWVAGAGYDAAADARISDWIELLYDQALVSEGAPLHDPAGFARRLTSLLTTASAGGADVAAGAPRG
jgi:molecular chaperone HtpG